MKAIKNKVAIIGLGEIATSRHIPAINKSDFFELAAIVDINSTLDGVDSFTTIAELIQKRPDINCVSLCTPPQFRLQIAKTALEAGLDVILEKPPANNLAEICILKDVATDNKRCIYTTWHSRFAKGVESAKKHLLNAQIKSVVITWKEDVRRWHPGQEWIWQSGGLGVFDTGINAISILTAILPQKIYLTSSKLYFPENKDTPITANLEFNCVNGVAIKAEFDWLQQGEPTWDMDIETESGMLKISNGGGNVAFNNKIIIDACDNVATEYDKIYAHFATLIANNEIDVDIEPFIHVGDAFMLGERITTSAFIE